MRKEIQLDFITSFQNQRSYMVLNAGPFVKEASRINSSQIRFLRSLSGVTLRDWMKSEETRKKWNVEEMIDPFRIFVFHISKRDFYAL